jgi:hypothetical protein
MGEAIPLKDREDHMAVRRRGFHNWLLEGPEVVWLEEISPLKNPLTSSRMEPATFQLKRNRIALNGRIRGRSVHRMK